MYFFTFPDETHEDYEDLYNESHRDLRNYIENSTFHFFL